MAGNELAVILDNCETSWAMIRESFLQNYRTQALEKFASQWPIVKDLPAGNELVLSVGNLFLRGLFFYRCNEASAIAVRNVMPNFWNGNPEDLLHHENEIMQALAANGEAYLEPNWPQLKLHPRWFVFKEELLGMILANPPNI